MRLFWYHHPHGNFGDDLNPWLWPRLLPGLIDGEGAWLVGIGTLLNQRLPREGELVILGAGVGLGTPPVVDARWRIHGVRGPMSCAALGIAPDLAIGDPAILAADLTPAAPVRHGTGFMPHYVSCELWDWRATAAELGLIFIDPRAPVEQTLTQIAGLQSLLSEAMHGAIVADALRTPWVRVEIDPELFNAKWEDWGLSVDLIPLPHRVPILSNIVSTLRDHAKRIAVAAGLGRWVTAPPPPPRSSPQRARTARTRLAALATSAPRQLSTDQAIQRAKARVRAAVEAVRVEHGSTLSGSARP